MTSAPNGYYDLHRWLLAEIPSLTDLVAEHIRDFDEVLPHLLMADVARFVEARRDAGDHAIVTAVLDALDVALGSADERIVNVVAVSFVEHFEPWSPTAWRFISQWPARLRSEAARQRDWVPEP